MFHQGIGTKQGLHGKEFPFSKRMIVLPPNDLAAALLHSTVPVHSVKCNDFSLSFF